MYSTYLGGSAANPEPYSYDHNDPCETPFGDIGLAIGVDADGNAYIAGVTAEADFPIVNGSPSSGAFISKLNATGSALVYSSVLGSQFFTIANALAVDAAGNAYVGGQAGDGFPTLNAIQPNFQGGSPNYPMLPPIDGFVLKMDPTGKLVYSTYLGCVSHCPGNFTYYSSTVANPQVTMGGIAAEVTYSGLAPNYVGLYQVNAVIPSGVTPGNAVPVVITINGVPSNTATLAIQ